MCLIILQKNKGKIQYLPPKYYEGQKQYLPYKYYEDEMKYIFFSSTQCKLSIEI